MFKFFKLGLVIEAETKGWIFETFEWALDNFGAEIFYKDTCLVKPTEKFFPDVIENEKDLVDSIFKRTKEYAGMEQWKTLLVAQESGANAIIAPTIAMENVPQDPAGTFSVSAKTGTAKITYRPEHVREPEKLIATFAHELAHYLSMNTEEPPPGGEENWEFATDLLSVFMGFGIFTCNSAFTINQYTNYDSQGWATESLGYMSQESLLYALAIFCELKNIDKKEVINFLGTSGLKSYYKKAVKDVILETEILNRLRNIEPEKSYR